AHADPEVCRGVPSARWRPLVTDARRTVSPPGGRGRTPASVNRFTSPYPIARADTPRPGPGRGPDGCRTEVDVRAASAPEDAARTSISGHCVRRAPRRAHCYFSPE